MAGVVVHSTHLGEVDTLEAVESGAPAALRGDETPCGSEVTAGVVSDAFACAELADVVLDLGVVGRNMDVVQLEVAVHGGKTLGHGQQEGLFGEFGGEMEEQACRRLYEEADNALGATARAGAEVAHRDLEDSDAGQAWVDRP